MKLPPWYLRVAAFLVIPILLDQCFKYYILASPDYDLALGPLRVALHKNYGVLFGRAEDVPPLVRNVTLVTVAFFLGSLLGLAHYFLPRRVRWLRFGMVLLLAGILGNTLDRLFRDFVVDYLQLDIGYLKTKIFNLADVTQWCGYGLIGLGIKKDWARLNFKNNGRHTFLLFPRFQIRFVLFVLFLVVSISTVMVVAAFTFLRVIANTPRQPHIGFTAIWLYYVAVLGTIQAAGALLAAFWALHYSHRIVGPLVALRRFLSQVGDDPNAHLKLREGDELTELKSIELQIRNLLSAKDKPPR